MLFLKDASRHLLCGDRVQGAGCRVQGPGSRVAFVPPYSRVRFQMVKLHPDFKQNRSVCSITNKENNDLLFGFIQPSVGRWQIRKSHITQQLTPKPADRKQMKGADGRSVDGHYHNSLAMCRPHCHNVSSLLPHSQGVKSTQSCSSR